MCLVDGDTGWERGVKWRLTRVDTPEVSEPSCANERLCHRYRRLAASGKAKAVVTTAIAREMVGFIWAIARHTQDQHCAAV